MSKTNVFMNFSSVTVTYGSGPTTITLTEVMDVEVHPSDHLEAWQADGHKFATVLVAASATRMMTIKGGDCYKLASLPRNTPCTVTAVLNDARNGTGSGAITITLINAVVADNQFSGPSNKFAGGTAAFMAYSSDGSTDPLSLTQAP